MLTVRPVAAGDIPGACALLNRIIAIGGTTAYETPFDAAAMTEALMGPDALACHVALDADGALAGFQYLIRDPDLPEGCASIASFTRRDDPVRGAGRALFAATRAAAERLGLREIDATIRADNAAGLGYYRGLGFVQRSATRAVPLADGTPVDRLHHRLALAG